MKILSAAQMREWDAYTILHEPITSIDLMERAANACVAWLSSQPSPAAGYFILCGAGNNGGDGLAIARLLFQAGCGVRVYLVGGEKSTSPDYNTNLLRLKESGFTGIQSLVDGEASIQIEQGTIVIDALFGTGLSRPAEGIYKAIIEVVNNSGATIVSIDLPSGLYTDASSKGNTIIQAGYTLTFQCLKLALLMQENGPFVGKVVVRDIGLSEAWLSLMDSAPAIADAALAQTLFRPRNAFAHKGTAGHALLIGGSYGKAGAILMASRACLHAGAGLTTAVVPAAAVAILQTALPEVMVLPGTDANYLSTLPAALEKFTSVGIGPGMGTEAATQNLVADLLRKYKGPLVIDADGLNCLALNQNLLESLPAQVILTPHPKEFDRLFGSHADDFSRMQTALQKAKALSAIIVLKSHHTLIALPDGNSFFNSTGNAGMAKGGSGDVLTGIITALLAQGYSPADAAVLGVYIHGLAGDFAALKYSMEAMTPTQLTEELSTVFLQLNQQHHSSPT